jgi:hypothetical protein
MTYALLIEGMPISTPSNPKSDITETTRAWQWEVMRWQRKDLVWLYRLLIVPQS